MAENNFQVNKGLNIKSLSNKEDELIIVGADGELIASGSTVADLSGGGGGASYTWIERTTNYTAAAYDGILADTTSSAFTITLPSSPSLGDSIIIIDAKSNFETNNVTVTSTDNIQGAVDDLVLDVNDATFELVWSGATNGWMIKTFLVNGAEPTNSLNDLTDVTTTGATTGDVLTFNGAEWVAAESTGGSTLMSPVECRRNAGQTIASSTTTRLDYNTKINDVDNTVTTGGSWKFTAPNDGTYVVCAQAGWLFTQYFFTSDNRSIFLEHLNSDESTLLGSYTQRNNGDDIGGLSASSRNTMNVSAVIKMNAGEILRVRVFHDSNYGSRTITDESNNNIITIAQVN